MNKITYMTPREQMVFSAIAGEYLISSEDMRGLFPGLGAHEINKICSGLSSKGYLYRLKNGVYLVQGKPSRAPIIKSPYNVALALFKGYVGFSSALRIYDILDYEPFTVFVVSGKSAKKKIGEYTFQSVYMEKKAAGMTYHRGVYVSTLPKTLFDCFYKPQYAGGYSVIAKAVYEAEPDWGEFINYFEKSSSSLCQRTGYVLELLAKETGKNIPQKVLDFLKKKIKNNTKLVPGGKAKGKYARGWMVLDNIGKENILSWWYHG